MSRYSETADRIAWILLGLLVCSLPIEKGLQIAGAGTISRTLGIAAFAASAVAIWMRGRLRRPNAALLLAAAFVAWSVLSWSWSYQPHDSRVRVFTMVQLLAMAWMIWEQCRIPPRVLRLVECFVAGGAVSTIWTITRAAMNRQTYYRRYATAGFDPNDLGITLTLVLAMALYLTVRHRGWRAWAARAVAVLCVAAILLTASRTALVAAYVNVAFLFLAWKVTNWKQRFSTAAIILLIAVGQFWLAPPASRRRLATLRTEATEGTLHDRTLIWKAGVTMWKQRPLIGIGSGAYQESSAKYLGRYHYNAHNTYLSVLVETGVAGAAMWGLLLVTIIFFAWRLDASQRAFWLNTLAVWGVGVLTVTWEHRKPTWLIFALIMCAWANAYRREEAED